MEQSREVNPHICGQLIYDKRVENLEWGKDSLFNKWYQWNWTAKIKRMKLDSYFVLHTNISSKGIKDLNVRLETTTLLEENTAVSS